MTSAGACKKKIFVIDDDRAIRDSISELLSRSGYYAQNFPDAVTALKVIKDEHADIFITDCEMPKIDGLAFTEIIRKWFPDSFIIGMSAKPRMQEFIQAGADEFLEKPFIFSAILSIVQAVHNERP